MYRLRTHPNVLSIYDFYELDVGYYYIVLECMEGGELFRRIEKKVPWFVRLHLSA